MTELAIKEKLDTLDSEAKFEELKNIDEGGASTPKTPNQKTTTEFDSPTTLPGGVGAKVTKEKNLNDLKDGKHMSLDSMKSLASLISDKWNLPIPMIVALQNTTKDKESANVLPWTHFKRLVYDIYIDRLNNAIEINNHLLTSYIPMNEFTCIYFLKVRDERVR